MSTDRQITANRANAQQSAGPKTKEAKCCGNGGTAERSLKLKKLAAKLVNVDVDGSASTAHVDVPKTY